MNPNQRFSILTFPQFYDGAELGLNIVVLPRDQNPLANAIEEDATIPDAPPFCDAQLSFTASIFDSLSGFPHNHAPIQGLALPAAPPVNSRAIFEALAAQLKIVKVDTTNRNVDLAAIPNEYKPPAARPREQTVKKYLPESYRQAFNFRSPRHGNLVTDDSYHCAIKGAKLVPGFERSGEFVSWGQVFAYLMRQPFLAEQAGLIYRTSVTVQATHFPNGGWLYIDLAPGSDYRQQLDADHTFIRRYRRGFRDWSPPSLATSSRRFSFRCSSRSPPEIRIRLLPVATTTSCSSRPPNTTTGLPRSSTAGSPPTATFSRRRATAHIPSRMSA